MFRKRYLKELTTPKATAAVEKLYDLAEGKKNLTLLYASRNEERNNATVLKELLEGGRKPPSSVGRAAVARGRSWGEQQQALGQLGRQYKKWKPPIGPVAALKVTGNVSE